MTIKDLMKKYIANDENFFNRLKHQKQLNIQLANDLNKIAPHYKSIQLFFDVIDNLIFAYKEVDPYSVIYFYKTLGVETIEDFIKLEEFLNTKYGEKLISFFLDQLSFKVSKININDLEKLSGSEVIDKVKMLIPSKYIENSCYWHLVDKEYYIPTLDILKNICKYSEINKLSYIPERRDCDDFSKLFKCELMKYGLGNLSIASIEINLYGNNFNGIQGAHAINLALCWNDNNYEVKLIEPQTDRIFNFGDTCIHTKYYKLRQVEF